MLRMHAMVQCSCLIAACHKEPYGLIFYKIFKNKYKVFIQNDLTNLKIMLPMLLEMPSDWYFC